MFDSFDEDELILPASEVSLTIPADFPEALAKAVGPTFRNKTELKSVHPQFYKRRPNLLRQLDLSKEEKVDILGKMNDDVIAYESYDYEILIMTPGN